MYCLLGSGEQRSEQVSNSQGLINFLKQTVNSISLIFECCPERTSIFTVNDPSHNCFQFRFESWIMEIFFIDHTLNVDGEDLKDPHRLLTGSSYIFIKNK